MTTQRIFAALLAAAALIVVLAAVGCRTPEPTVVPTATPTPTASPSPTAAPTPPGYAYTGGLSVANRRTPQTTTARPLRRQLYCANTGGQLDYNY